MARIIDLDEIAGHGAVKNLSGKPRGEAARAHYDLEQEDKRPEGVVVRIPTYVLMITSSFFLGLFSPSIETLGEAGFRNKYQFEANQDQMTHVQRGMDRALASRSPFMPIETSAA